MRFALIGALLAAASTPAHARVSQRGIDALEAALNAQDSATAVLTARCASGAITATPVRGEDALPAPDLNDTLSMAETDEPGYRHVRLSCGGVVLSQAHNWYVPARLTPEMNAALATTDTPFGKVAAPLLFQRQRLNTQRGAAPGCPTDTVLSQRALLRLPDGRPLALVVECYTPAAAAQ
ncbi:hypothetical protein GTZ99_00595 [Novosphingobium sp. FSY-8]|uniref:Chorismate lyase n=1 Tax=Novosphingobium ovatum TaxID=1908523 RepID=A0ABW9X946_9SPHN|nr:hypothetical protein [Novosphingobium ovatum]NBC35051.1 hypothetical protein [Novosphingobium ovatum]